MGKPTGFVEWSRLVPARRAIAERLGDWREVDTTGAAAQVQPQAGRCMDCGVPFCTQGCPLGNAIPDFAELVYQDRWRDAYRRLASTNDFPEFTGRLCPAPCEAACVLALDGAAVTIEAIERAVIERAFAEGWVVAAPPRVRTHRRVAVIGSGPAGLAAASQLNRAGHTVTVFEAAARAGGLLRYGIPDFKLDKAILDRRLALVEAEGIELRCGVAVDEAMWELVRADHDAVVLAVGAQRPRDLIVPGRELAGVLQAMDYLTDQNEVIGGEKSTARFDVRGKRVIILGGGDTGSDCLGTALRQGAAEVSQIELMPVPPGARGAANPWPTWPMIFRTSSSQEEGGERGFGLRTTHLEGDAGKLVALHAARVERDANGLRETGETVRLPVDTLILALGFTGPIADDLGVRLDHGRVAIDARYATSIPGVFAAGDAHRGASLIVWAIADGREAARHADAYLRGAASSLPAIGQSTPF